MTNNEPSPRPTLVNEFCGDCERARANPMCPGSWFVDLPSGEERKMCGVYASLEVFMDVIAEPTHKPGRPRKTGYKLVSFPNPFLIDIKQRAEET